MTCLYFLKLFKENHPEKQELILCTNFLNVT